MPGGSAIIEQVSGDRRRSTNDRLFAVAAAAALDETTAEVVRALDGAGVRTILLRGPVIAGWLYPTAGERGYGDADLLVPPASFRGAEEVLRRLGFHESTLEAAFPGERPGHAHTWFRPGGLAIDLHRTLVGIGVPPEEAWNVLAEGTERLTLSDVEVHVLSRPATLAILALHAAHHAGAGDQPVRDLDRAINSASADEWSAALDITRRLDAVPAFSAGLRVLPAGRDLASSLGLDASTTPPSELVGSPAFHLAQGVAWFRALRGPRAKAAFVGRKLVPTPERMRARSRLARRGPVGLAGAYVMRWLSALREGARAVRQRR